MSTAAGSNNLFTIRCDLSTIDERGWIADIRSNSALNPGISKRGHSDSFELAERRISDGGDCRRRDHTTRSYKLKRDTRNMICGAHGDRCTRAAPDRGPHTYTLRN